MATTYHPTTETRSDTTSDPANFAQLRREIAAQGLLKPRHDYYAWKIPTNIALLAAGWAAFLMVGNSWWQLLVAVYLGVFYVQTALVGHDAGHLQITGSPRAHEILGYINGNLLLGLSHAWWVPHHNSHHYHPNHVARDPAVRRRRGIIFTADQVSKPNRVARFIIRHQGVLFFPLLTLGSIGLRSASIRVLYKRAVPRVWLEALLIGIHFVAYFLVVFSVLSLPLGIIFIVIHQATFGFYIGAILAPNHKGQPLVEENESLDWLTRQVITARNIRSGRIADFVFGGLNYQIEHHLFPTMPRVNLRKARPTVKRHCQEHGVTYHETSLLGSYAEVAGYLTNVSRQYRARTES